MLASGCPGGPCTQTCLAFAFRSGDPEIFVPMRSRGWAPRISGLGCQTDAVASLGGQNPSGIPERVVWDPRREPREVWANVWSGNLPSVCPFRPRLPDQTRPRYLGMDLAGRRNHPDAGETGLGNALGGQPNPTELQASIEDGPETLSWVGRAPTEQRCGGGVSCVILAPDSGLVLHAVVAQID